MFFLKFSAESLHFTSFSALLRCSAPLSPKRFCLRFSTVSLQCSHFSESLKYFAPSSPMSLQANFNSVRLFTHFSASFRCSTPLTPILVLFRWSLVSLQFPSLIAVLRSSASLSPMWLLSRISTVRLQFLSFSVSHKYSTPFSPILLWVKSNSTQLLLTIHFLISMQPKSPMKLNPKCSVNFSSRFLSKCKIAVQSAGASLHRPNHTSSKDISSILLVMEDSCFMSSSYKHLHMVTAKFVSLSPCGQRIDTVGFSVIKHSVSSSPSWPPTLEVDMGRSFIKILLICSCLTSSVSTNNPATNCTTNCHEPSLMWSSINSSNAWASVLVSTTCLAARNSWNVRWMKQYWALSSSSPSWLGRSGKRWSNPQSSSPSTSSEVKSSLPSLIPSKASFPSFWNSFLQSVGNSWNGFKKSWSRASSLMRYLSLCLK